MAGRVVSPEGLLLDPHSIGLATDLYQLTMAAGYHCAGKTGTASFELFVRKLPTDRGYLIAAGLEQAVHGLLNLRFPAEAVEVVRRQPAFAAIPADFFARLGELRFTGDLDAVPEGTPVFANQPLLRVTAPLVEAQLVETYLLSAINFPTLAATKAHRIVRAARGRGVAEFGTRRAHGPQAALYAARSAYLAGCSGTSNVLAGARLGVPVIGTAAHSWTMTFDSEPEAFAAYHAAFPEHSVLLVDTYDTLEGTRRAAAIGPTLQGIRLDSGDLDALSRECRALLDAAGLTDARIVASGDLDEHRIDALLAAGAPIDLFGVGTALSTCRDQPALGGVYKLVELDGAARVKLSPGKETYAGRKQVYRQREGDAFTGDVVALVDEPPPGGAPLLQPVLRGGALVSPLPTLDEARARCADQTGRLPEGVLRLTAPDTYAVRFTDAVRAATAEAAARH